MKFLAGEVILVARCFMRSTLFFILCVFLFSSSFSSGENRRPSSIPSFEPDVPNLMQARDKVYTGGQPTTEGMQRLSALGIKLIVNLRPHDEKGARDESSEAAAYGMKYTDAVDLSVGAQCHHRLLPRSLATA
jgi:hypothetical protein